MTNFAHPHESTGDIEVAESKKYLSLKEPWAARERERGTLGESEVRADCSHRRTDQTSNLHLSDEQVMKKRTRNPVVSGSSAKPLSGAGTNQPDDFSFTKKTGGDF